MLLTALRGTRIGIRVAWIVTLGAVLILLGGPAVLRLAGIDSYTVRGGSMSPNIPLGAIVLVQHVQPADVAANDVITFRAPNGTVVTHRVLGRSAGSDPTFITKGDANPTPDPNMVPSSELVGRVVVSVPFAGTLIAALSTRTGVVTVAALLFCLVVGGWFIDELRTTLVAPAKGEAAAEPVG